MLIDKTRTSHNNFHTRRANAVQGNFRKNLGSAFMMIVLILSTAAAASAQRVNWYDLVRNAQSIQITNQQARLNKKGFVLSNLSGASGALVAANDVAPKKKSIVGSWMETVTLSVPGNPSFKSLSTFTEDGGLIVADQGNVNVAAATLYSAGHGVWAAQEGSTINWTVVELVSDLEGNLIGTLKIRGRYTVDESGNSYTGVFLAEQVDADGNLMFSVEGTNAGNRIQLEPLP